MGIAERRQKDQATAMLMKELGIERTTGACPNHCGAQLRVGGPALVAHLNSCWGTRRKGKR